jgi:hypothetical protein
LFLFTESRFFSQKKPHIKLIMTRTFIDTPTPIPALAPVDSPLLLLAVLDGAPCGVDVGIGVLDKAKEVKRKETADEETREEKVTD